MSEKRKNQLTPVTAGVGVGLNIQRGCVSPSRLYMLGKNISKAACIKNPTPRLINTGDEQEYAKTNRKIKLDCNATVEKVFFVRDPFNPQNPIHWGCIHVVFKSEDGRYFLKDFPKFHSQNVELGFEYHYDKNLQRRLRPGEFFSAGTVFGESSRISDQGEWCPGIQAKVALLSHYDNEEDAIKISKSFARKVGVVFEKKFEEQWDEQDYVLLNLYGDEENYKPFPYPGETVREDGILFGLRKKDFKSALVSLTNKSLMDPDPIYDRIYYAPQGSVVADIVVMTERYKNQSNNRSAYKKTYPHTRDLEHYETMYNAFYNDVFNWYVSKCAKFQKNETPPIDDHLWNFIFNAQCNITKYNESDNVKKQYNNIKRKFGNKKLKDWHLVIKMKQEVDAKVRFKMTGMHGNKSTIGKIVDDEMMPIDDYGVRAEIVVSNLPDFRRQIFSSLIEADVNFINMRIQPEIKEAYNKGDYEKAWNIATEFYETVSPFYNGLINQLEGNERIEHLKLISENENEFSVVFDDDVYGIEIIKRLEEKYGHIQPTPVTYINEYGETIRTLQPILISSIYYLMLDKFGDDNSSSQSTPRLNVFGLPATAVSKEERSRNFFRAQVNRNVGAPEGRLMLNQSGGALAVQQLVLGNSPEALEMAVKRIMRADNPFLIDRIIYPGEETKNASIGYIKSALNDYGIAIRKQNKDDII